MPGAAWKRKGEAYRANMDQMTDTPHRFVKEQMVRASVERCYPSCAQADVAAY